MFNTKPTQKFIDGFRKLRPDADEYEFISPYIAATAPIKVKHLVCGLPFDTTPAYMTRKEYWQVCPHCRKTQSDSKTFEDIKKEVEELGNGDFELLKDFSDEEHKHLLTLKHKVCGAEFEAYRHNLIAWKLICPGCKAGSAKHGVPKKSTEEMKKQIKEDSLGRYELISEYEGSTEPIIILDTETGKDDITYSSNLYAKIRQLNPTMKSRKNSLLSQEAVEEMTERESDGRYKLVSRYQGSNGEVDVLDNETGKVDTIKYQTLRIRLHKIQKQKQQMTS